eukprot:scaffold28126_cov19-Tisochrysis_lutea.AAC.1
MCERCERSDSAPETDMHMLLLDKAEQALLCCVVVLLCVRSQDLPSWLSAFIMEETPLQLLAWGTGLLFPREVAVTNAILNRANNCDQDSSVRTRNCWINMLAWAVGSGSCDGPKTARMMPAKGRRMQCAASPGGSIALRKLLLAESTNMEMSRQQGLKKIRSEVQHSAETEVARIC